MKPDFNDTSALTAVTGKIEIGAVPVPGNAQRKTPERRAILRRSLHYRFMVLARDGSDKTNNRATAASIANMLKAR